MGGLTITYKKPKPIEVAMRADRRLSLSKDRTRIVEYGDPDGGFLWRGAGKDITRAEAKRFGLSEDGGKVVLPGQKMQAPAENKMVAPAENKEKVPEDYTVAELKDIAKAKGVAGYYAMSKDELIAAVFAE